MFVGMQLAQSERSGTADVHDADSDEHGQRRPSMSKSRPRSLRPRYADVVNNTSITSSQVQDHDQSQEPEHPRVVRNEQAKKPIKRAKVGSATSSSSFMGGGDTISVQITNVNAAVKEDAIRDHITMELSTGIDDVTIKDTTTEGWPTKRFLITFPREVRDRVLDPGFWPPQVYFRQYFVSRGQGLKPKASNG